MTRRPPPPPGPAWLLPDGQPDEPLLDALRLVAEGCTNAVIAGRLQISVHTVRSRMKVLFRALGARDRAHAVALGYRRGYLDDAAHRADCAALRPRPCDCGAAPTETETGG